MEHLGEHLQEEMNIETVFQLPIGDGIPVYESTVVSWIVMGVMIAFAILITSGFRVRKLSNRQIYTEGYYTYFRNMVRGMLSHEAMGFAPYFGTVIFFIGLCNIFGIFGFKPPTKDLNVTAALALMTIVLNQVAAIRGKGVGGWLGSFKANPMNVLELITRPLSLAMRLFGNVLGAFVIMKLIEAVVPVVLPGFVSLYFDIFDGLLQAYVFTFLSSLFISEAME